MNPITTSDVAEAQLSASIRDAASDENLQRLRFLGPVLVVVHLAHVVVFALLLGGGSTVGAEAAQHTWRLLIAEAHGVAAAVALLGSFLAYRADAKARATRVGITLAAVFYMLFGAALAGVDQLVTNAVSAYIVVSLGAALAVRLPLLTTLLSYAAALLTLWLTCQRFQPDEAMRLSANVNGLTATALGVGLSVYANSMLKRRTAQALVIAAQRAALSRANDELSHLASHDMLTELPNRRAFARELETALKAAREGEPSTLALIDLDHFKTVNDRFGHPRGDEVLRVCAQVIRDTLRTDDHAARLGGEEFGVLLRGTAPAQAAALLEKLRLSIAAQSWAEDDLHVTASIGYAELRADDQSDARDALRRADAALYAVKASGRDQIQAG